MRAPTSPPTSTNIRYGQYTRPRISKFGLTKPNTSTNNRRQFHKRGRTYISISHVPNPVLRTIQPNSFNSRPTNSMTRRIRRRHRNDTHIHTPAGRRRRGVPSHRLQTFTRNVGCTGNSEFVTFTYNTNVEHFPLSKPTNIGTLMSNTTTNINIRAPGEPTPPHQNSSASEASFTHSSWQQHRPPCDQLRTSVAEGCATTITRVLE